MMFWAKRFALNVGFLKFATGQIYNVFFTPILKPLVVPVIWLALIGAIYSKIAPIFALNRIFFPANEEATLKTKPIRFKVCLK